jgi:uncharacterized protein (TIGR00251 family)
MAIFHIRVKPGASKNKVDYDEDHQRWMFYIRAKAIDGEANAYLINLLSKQLKLPKRDIQLLKGEKSPFKQLEIAINAHEFREKMLAF